MDTNVISSISYPCRKIFARIEVSLCVLLRYEVAKVSLKGVANQLEAFLHTITMFILNEVFLQLDVIQMTSNFLPANEIESMFISESLEYVLLKPM